MATRKGHAAGDLPVPPAPRPDPLDVAKDAARGLNRVARMAQDEQRRNLVDDQPLGPAGDFGEAPAEFDELDALAAQLQGLEGDAGEIRMDLYLVHPLPPGFKERMHVGRIDGMKAVDDLGEEIERRLQARGRWGPMQLYVACKARSESGAWQYIRGASRTLAVDVPKTDAAVTAAAAVGATPAAQIDPLATARTIIDIGRAVTPPAPEKSPAEMMAPLITSFASAVEKLSASSSGTWSEVMKALVPVLPPLMTRLTTPPKDDSIEKFAQMMLLFREGGMGGSNGGTTMRDAIALAKMLADATAGAAPAGERSVSDRVFDFLDRHAESALGRLQSVLDLARARTAARVTAVPTPPGEPAAPRPALDPALVDFQRELDMASTRYDTGYFPTLRERVVTLFTQGGPEMIAMIETDPQADAVALQRLEQVGVALTPVLRRYLGAFCNWLRYIKRTHGSSAPAPATNGAAAAGGIKARCEKCGTGYQLDDEQQWEQDTKVCDQPNCGGQLIRL